MTFTFLVIDYARWHYTTALQSGFHLWMNFIIFTAHQFMISLHARTLFAPWHRMTETRSKKWDWEDWAETLLVNSVSRLLGFFLRSIIILSGLLLIAIQGVGLFFGYAIWLLAPVVVTGMTFTGVAFLITFLYGFI